MKTSEKTPLRNYPDFTNRLRFSDENGKNTMIIDITYKDDRLSIVGEYNGGGGQIYDELLQQYPESAGLVGIWKEWHLNDMNPNCEHQREWDTAKLLTVYRFKMDSNTSQHIRDIKAQAIEAAKKQEVCDLTDYEIKLLDAEYFIESHVETPPFGYELRDTKTERAGWVRPSEHPDGLLTRPCGVCGYKYGTEWKFRTVPRRILIQLKYMVV